ncbi:hypothetical protein MJD09_19250, partial [bacterium]|nr:hypothetical protein [bacterium]
MTRSIQIAVTLALPLLACQHHLDLEVQGHRAPDDVFHEQISFSTKDATLIFNNKVLSEQVTLMEPDFGFFFMWVKNEGLFAVTIHPISIAVPAGRFTGNK